MRINRYHRLDRGYIPEKGRRSYYARPCEDQRQTRPSWGTSMDPDQDAVTLDGRSVTRQNTLLVAMYKPGSMF
ncbi:MAG: hypothetical protein MZU91_03080 [Desulfosudis oleivorans]|nr:hypothetical protein [Desulfosudis oleivorans]